jgi:hypothetical protein
MRTNRTGDLMAMLAGLSIVGASTGGILAATSHHNITLAAEQSASAAALESSSATDTPAAPQSSPPMSADGQSPSVPGPSAPAPTPPASSAPASPAPVGSVTSPVPTRSSTPVATTTASGRPVTSSKAPTPAAPAAALKYKDGQYSATGSYNSPGGIEKLGVMITLASDKVVKSNLDLLGGAGLSHSFQTAFQSGYSGQVIGKNIDSISLGAVSGSSLTGMGFNVALKQIESQAKK